MWHNAKVPTNNSSELARCQTTDEELVQIGIVPNCWRYNSSDLARCQTPDEQLVRLGPMPNARRATRPIWLDAKPGRDNSSTWTAPLMPTVVCCSLHRSQWSAVAYTWHDAKRERVNSSTLAWFQKTGWRNSSRLARCQTGAGNSSWLARCQAGAGELVQLGAVPIKIAEETRPNWRDAKRKRGNPSHLA